MTQTFATGFPGGMPIRKGPSYSEMPTLQPMQGLAGDIGQGVGQMVNYVDKRSDIQKQQEDMIQKRQMAQQVERSRQEWLQKDHEFNVAKETREQAGEERRVEQFGIGKKDRQAEIDKAEDLKTRTGDFYKQWRARDKGMDPEAEKKFSRDLLAEWKGQSPEDFLKPELGAGGSRARPFKIRTKDNRVLIYDPNTNTTFAPPDPLTGEAIEGRESYTVVPGAKGMPLLAKYGGTTKESGLARELPAAFKSTSREKIAQVTLVRNALEDVAERFKSNTVAFGRSPAKWPTADGEIFDSALALLRKHITAMLRVKGIGSMSDYETALDEAVLPKRNAWESVTTDTIERLFGLADAIEDGYYDVLTNQDIPKLKKRVEARRAKDRATLTPEKVNKMTKAGKKKAMGNLLRRKGNK